MQKNRIMMMPKPTKLPLEKKSSVLRIHFLNLRIMFCKKQLLPNKQQQFQRHQLVLDRILRKLLIGLNLLLLRFHKLQN